MMAGVAEFGEDEVDERRWTMPLVVRIERADPPTHTDVLEAVAKACLAVAVDDERTAEEWAAAFGAWRAGRSRKVVRRARGAHWRAVADVPGVTVASGSAEVRAFPPMPAADLPKELSRLQVGGTDLVDPDPLGSPSAGGAMLWLHPSLVMTTGKAAAQAGHAALLVFEALSVDGRSTWRLAGYPLAVRRADDRRWADVAGGPVEIADGGFTEIDPGSVTVRAELPPATMG